MYSFEREHVTIAVNNSSDRSVQGTKQCLLSGREKVRLSQIRILFLAIDKCFIRPSFHTETAAMATVHRHQAARQLVALATLVAVLSLRGELRRQIL